MNKNAIMNTLELAARRRNCNAILIDGTGWEFIRVQKGEKP